MLSIDPLKNLGQLWDRIERARLPQRLKAVLLTIVTLAMLFDSFWMLFLLKQISDIISKLIGH